MGEREEFEDPWVRFDGQGAADAPADWVRATLLRRVAELRAENENLRTVLDSRFEHSDHQSAKYYMRMRTAERVSDMNAAQRDEAVQILGEVRAERDALQAESDNFRDRVAKLEAERDALQAEWGVGYAGVHVDRYPNEDAARIGVTLFPGHELVKRVVGYWEATD